MLTEARAEKERAEASVRTLEQRVVALQQGSPSCPAPAHAQLTAGSPSDCQPPSSQHSQVPFMHDWVSPCGYAAHCVLHFQVWQLRM